MSSEESRKFREEQRKHAMRGMNPQNRNPRQASSRPTPRQTTSRQSTTSQTRTSSTRVPNVQLVNPRKGRENDMAGAQSRVLKAPAGTARNAASKERIVTPPLLKLVSLLAAASIGLGTLGAIGHYRESTERFDNTLTITQLANQGVDINNIGLEEDTLELLERYDEYFTNYNPDMANELSNNDLIEMAEDIRTLNFNTIKDKIAELVGVSREDVTLGLNFEKGDGFYHTSVRINEYDVLNREIYNNTNGWLFGIGKENSIPPEISDLIVQTEEYDDLITQIRENRISKQNAVEQLRELYENISENVAVKDFVIDDNGNISLSDYGEQTKEQEEKGEER